MMVLGRSYNRVLVIGVPCSTLRTYLDLSIRAQLPTY